MISQNSSSGISFEFVIDGQSQDFQLIVSPVKNSTSSMLCLARGGFVSLRHNLVRNITSFFSEVCKDVRVEPQLQPLASESFTPSTATGNEVRLDVCARGFWQAGQIAFFDVMVFNPNARRYAKQELSKTYELNEKEKKCLYNERILQVEHGTFTPLVMSTTGGMGRESSKFYSFLSELTSEKTESSYSSCNMDTTKNYICIN